MRNENKRCASTDTSIFLQRSKTECSSFSVWIAWTGISRTHRFTRFKTNSSWVNLGVPGCEYPFHICEWVVTSVDWKKLAALELLLLLNIQVVEKIHNAANTGIVQKALRKNALIHTRHLISRQAVTPILNPFLAPEAYHIQNVYVYIYIYKLYFLLCLYILWIHTYFLYTFPSFAVHPFIIFLRLTFRGQLQASPLGTCLIARVVWLSFLLTDPPEHTVISAKGLYQGFRTNRPIQELPAGKMMETRQGSLAEASDPGILILVITLFFKRVCLWTLNILEQYLSLGHMGREMFGVDPLWLCSSTNFVLPMLPLQHIP